VGDAKAAERTLALHGLGIPSASALLADVHGLGDPLHRFLFHACLRLVRVPEGVVGYEAIMKERAEVESLVRVLQSAPRHTRATALPPDYARFGSNELAADAYAALPMGLVRVEWEVRAADAAKVLEEKLAGLGCTTVADLLHVDFDVIGE
jgi:hypothetical protein